MAKRNEKKVELDKWAAYFPDMMPWRTQWLLRRHGPLLSGICLDTTSDPTRYHPIFFFYNLLVSGYDEPALCYAERLIPPRYNGPLPVKYGSEVKPLAEKLRSQVPTLRNLITFECFIKRVRQTLNAEYPPHVLFDIIMIGSYVGGKKFYAENLDKCINVLNKIRKSERYATMISPERWADETEVLLRQDLAAQTEQRMADMKLPEMPDMGLPAKDPIIKEFWKLVL